MLRSPLHLVLWINILLCIQPVTTASSSPSTTRLVTSTQDSGPGTLRQALLAAEAGDTISFSTTVFPPGGSATIFAHSSLPVVTKNGVILNASNAGVTLDGSLAPSGVNGITLNADNCVVQGLTIRGFKRDGIMIMSGASGNTVGGSRSIGAGPNGQGNTIIANGADGVEITGAGADNNVLRGNYIGVDRTGAADAGNTWSGVAIKNGARNNTIGGAASGYRNVIGGNNYNGVWIGGAGTNGNVVIGNYIGTRADGLGAVPNGQSGVSIPNGARNNRVGGAASGEGNLISGNHDFGIFISDAGTSGNRVLGNLIGPDRTGNATIGQGLGGVIIQNGASSNAIGDGTSAGRNVISGNTFDGIHLLGSDTFSNTVQGNFIGANASGAAALPNTLHGVELSAGAHHNLVGGDGRSGQGNLLSGNLNHGLVITSFAHDNQIAGNIIGPDATGTYFLGNHPWGGADISNGASYNMIGGWDPGDGNLISGNPTDGIAIFQSNADPPIGNDLVGNIVGLALDGDPLPNGGAGIFNVFGARETAIERNTVAHNAGYGIVVANCNSHMVKHNSVYSNVLGGIRSEGNCVSSPVIRVASVGASDVVTGTTIPRAHIEIFSDDDSQAQVYEGEAKADNHGYFSFSKSGGFTGPNVTATSRDDDNNNTSELSQPAHVAWTVMFYLNGDNDLDEFMRDTISNTVAAGASPQANVLALFDGNKATAPISDTVLYDLTRGQARPLPAMRGERNMGDKQTLIDFVAWSREHYPARHSMLAIVDHGGGWAPSSVIPGIGPLPWRDHWQAGGSGLSWDFNSDYDYLNSAEIRQAMAAITANGTKKLDVVYYDVCLMGMLEVAYQIKDYASYFVSSQNIGWAPLGPDARYVRTVQQLPVNATPAEMARQVVESYADSLPQEEHPFTVAAVDLASMSALAGDVSNLANAIRQTLTGPSQAALLKSAYTQAQKIDYDADFRIEPATDGFIDLYDFALKLAYQYPNSPVSAAGQALIGDLTTAVIEERHRSGHPYVEPQELWDLDGSHGLSIFLPLGEDLELVVTDTVSLEPSDVVTRHVRLRDLYTSDQLEFVGNTTWKTLIDTYYDVVATPVPTMTMDGPISGLIAPDITPPETVIAITGLLRVGQPIHIAWTSSDAQAGVDTVTLWRRAVGGAWVALDTRPGASGVFDFTPTKGCRQTFAVQATDRAGNVEPLENGQNTKSVFVVPCRLSLPKVQRTR